MRNAYCPLHKLPLCIWACGILHFMYSVASHAASEPFLCFSHARVQLKEPVAVGQSQAHGLTWPASLNFIPEMREVSSDLTMTLCPDFQMVLMLFINLGTSHWHGSQPGLNALGVTTAVRARGQWGSPKFLSGLHLTGQVSILPPSAFDKIRWRWLSTQESCVLFVFVSSSHLL